jgi:hypothetical protein
MSPKPGASPYVASPRQNWRLAARKVTEAIRLGEVLRHTEPDMALVWCFDRGEYPLRNPALLRVAERAGEGVSRFRRRARRLYPDGPREAAGTAASLAVGCTGRLDSGSGRITIPPQTL